MGSFALPSGYNWDVKLFTRQVKTKKWAKEFSHKLGKYADKFNNANSDNYQTVGSMLQAAYGYNIGEQILSKLDSGHIDKIRSNVIQAVYY
tara:strand:+ start:1376 stop:1648 length:273 start_codon:yes stop_codon:yes gene_type:complete